MDEYPDHLIIKVTGGVATNAGHLPCPAPTAIPPVIIRAPPRLHPEGMSHSGRGLLGRGGELAQSAPTKTRLCEYNKTGILLRGEIGAGAERTKKGDGMNGKSQS